MSKVERNVIIGGLVLAVLFIVVVPYFSNSSAATAGASNS